MAQTILKATPQLEAQLHGRQAAPGSPTPGALMLRSLLHAGVGGLDLLGVSTAEELAERLKQEVRIVPRDSRPGVYLLLLHNGANKSLPISCNGNLSSSAGVCRACCSVLSGMAMPGS